MHTLPFCVPAMAAALALFAPAGVDEASPAVVGQHEIVHYDYEDNGVLRGGRLEVGPEDPVHAFILPAQGPAATFELVPPWEVTTLMNNGPAANRVNLVVLGDGYTAEELDLYAEEVDALLDGFFEVQPFETYASYFNVYRVDVVSAESGVDEPGLSIFRDTALDMTYGCAGVLHLLCVDLTKAHQAATLAPAVDQVVVLANSQRYGGAGYVSADVATVAAGYPGAVNLVLHEFGHAFGNLADEYFPNNDTTYSGPERPEANATIHDATALADFATKWAAWLDHLQVDAFEGCRYAHYGLHRPTASSKMRSLSQPFGPVNTEQFVLQLYALVSPIDEPTAVFDDQRSCAGPRTTLRSGSLRPQDHDLEIAWFLDGTRLRGFNDTTLRLADLDLAEGVSSISVVVSDMTTMVRDELARARWMTATTAWLIEPCPDKGGPAGRSDPRHRTARGTAWHRLTSWPGLAASASSTSNLWVGCFPQVHAQH